jgi:hypothetical protein
MPFGLCLDTEKAASFLSFEILEERPVRALIQRDEAYAIGIPLPVRDHDLPIERVFRIEDRRPSTSGSRSRRSAIPS